MSQLFRRKSVADCDNDIAERGGLKRHLNKWHLTALVSAPPSARDLRDDRHRHRRRSGSARAGPAIVLSFILTAVACGFAALCYAEFAAMVPISGSAYTYAYASLGEFVAWIIGWDLIVEYAVGNIGVAIGGRAISASWSAISASRSPRGWPPIHARRQWPRPRSPAGRPIRQSLLRVGPEQAPHVFGIPIIANLPAFLAVAVITVVLVIGIRNRPTPTTRWCCSRSGSSCSSSRSASS
jgi:APA family basic amino acid/polyamine antiporter